MVYAHYNSYFEKSSSELVIEVETDDQCPEPPKYWGLCLWEWNPFGNLRTPNRVFDSLGYVAVNATDGDDWDVLWSIEFPYFRPSKMFDPVYRQLKPHQRVNHFPGFSYLTDKSFMTTRNRNVKRILPGFRFPRMINEFKAYLAENPNSRFVEKSLGHGGVSFVNRSQIVFDNSEKSYQLFMDRPFLVDGYFMDFSNYVLVSSINPLRIYRFDEEVHARFCPKLYHPFDPMDRDKYVVSTTGKFCVDHPTLKTYYNHYGTCKLSLEKYFERKGHNVSEFWRKIDETIVQLVLNNEKNILNETMKLYNSTHHFFNLVRIDFLLDEELEPHLTEVNMFSGMFATEIELKHLSPVYEQTIHDSLVLVGAGSKAELMSRNDPLSNAMLSSSKNISPDPKLCILNDCMRDCNKSECKLCKPCLETEDIDNMHRAYREHTSRGGFKRIFPSENHFDVDFISKATPRNQISLKWFKAKCEENSEWC